MGQITQQFIPGPRLIDGSDLNSLVSQINGLLGGTGVVYYVNETIGNDGGTTSTAIGSNNGLNPSYPLKTIDAARYLEKAALTAAGLSTVGRNSVVCFWGTQHRTSTLTWDMPATHLVGIGEMGLRGKRARISVTGTTAFDKLVNVTKQGCAFMNFGTFYGFNDAAANLCWQDDAGRNYYYNVEFMGFGDGTASTGTANHTAARAFKASTNFVGETTWERCVFGVDTVTRNATNYTLEIAPSTPAPRCSMVDCAFESYLGASGGSSSHLLVGVAGIDRYLDLVRCRFHNSGNSGSTTMAQCFNVSVSAGGTVLMDQCVFGPGITAWQTAPTANVVMNMTAPGTGGGKAIQNA